MSFHVIANKLTTLSGEVLVNPLSTIKELYGGTNRDILMMANSQDYDDLLKHATLKIGSFFESGGFNSKFKHILNYVVPLSGYDPSNNLLRLAYFRLLDKLLETPYKSFFIPFLGRDKGYDIGIEGQIAHHIVAEFALKHQDLDFYLIEPSVGASGEKVVVPPSPKHLSIKVPQKEFTSYWAYLVFYTDERAKSGYPIKNITNEDELKIGLYETGCFVSSQFSKWKNKQKSKTSENGKRGAYYYPCPSKKYLFLICLVLDMSFEEAKDVFFAFGYGLSKFDKVEAFYLDILENTPRDDLERINQELVQEFSTKEGFWDEMDERVSAGGKPE
jgi:hypothetical protein